MFSPGERICSWIFFRKVTDFGEFSREEYWRYSFISKAYDPYDSRSGSENYRQLSPTLVERQKRQNLFWSGFHPLILGHGSTWIGPNFPSWAHFPSTSIVFGPGMTLFLTICGAESCLRGLSWTRKLAKCDNGRQKRCTDSTESSPDLSTWAWKHAWGKQSVCLKEKKARNASKTESCGEIWHSSSDHSYRTEHPTKLFSKWTPVH